MCLSPQDTSCSGTAECARTEAGRGVNLIAQIQSRRDKRSAGGEGRGGQCLEVALVHTHSRVVAEEQKAVSPAVISIHGSACGTLSKLEDLCGR